MDAGVAELLCGFAGEVLGFGLADFKRSGNAALSHGSGEARYEVGREGSGGLAAEAEEGGILDGFKVCCCFLWDFTAPGADGYPEGNDDEGTGDSRRLLLSSTRAAGFKSPPRRKALATLPSSPKRASRRRLWP